MWQAVKTFVFVTVVACFLWLYAESENVKSQELDVDIQFVAPSGVQLAIKPSQPQRVHLRLRCGAAKFTEAERLARSGPIPLVVRDDPASSNSHFVVVLKERLADSKLANLGVNIVEVQPKTIEGTVERQQKVVLPVDVFSGDVQLTWTAEPDKVEVWVPASLAASLADARAEARLDAKDLSRLDANVPRTMDVLLSQPDWLKSMGVSLDLPRAKITVKIRVQNQTYVVPRVPVLILGPPIELSRFSVALNKDNLFLHDIALTGPSDAIERIRKDEVRVTACLTLSAEDLEKGVAKESVALTPVLNLPPGVTPVEALAPLTCKISKIAPAPVSEPAPPR